MSNGLSREELIQWVTHYKDVAERNALAETPEETADYLLSLLPPVRAHTLKEMISYVAKEGSPAYIYEGEYTYDTRCDNVIILDKGDWEEYLKGLGIMPGENDG